MFMARKSLWYEMDKELEQCHNLVINTTRLFLILKIIFHLLKKNDKNTVQRKLT